MRRVRWLLLVAIVCLVAGVGSIFHRQQQAQSRREPPAPKALPENVSAAASDWRWSKNDGDRPIVEVRAKSFRHFPEPLREELEGVELRLYHQDGKIYDRVRSAKAEFRVAENRLYSEGEVEITMALPSEGERRGRLLVIRSSGVSFDSNTGVAATERQTQFAFDEGEGKSAGASYDPAARELFLKSAVELVWRGKDPKTKPMKVEAAEGTYKEKESRVLLGPWARLTRDTLTLDAGPSVVNLENGVIKLVEAQRARGSELRPARRLDYSADLLHIHFGKNLAEKITAETNARLVETSDSGRTEVKADRVEMDFDTSSGDSVLTRAAAHGRATVESRPARRGSAPPPPNRVLHSEAVELRMRPGGEEIQNIDTHAPGWIEFVPNHASQRHRRLDGERMWIVYGRENRLESFRAANVSTRTRGRPPQEKEKEKQKQPAPDALTWSQELLATFDEKTGDMTRIEQWENFRYEEGDRRARATRAMLESASEVINLEGSARLWDLAGSTAAGRIRLDQKSGDIEAEGNVESTRLPEEKKAAASAGASLMEPGEPVQAKAEKMITRDRNRTVVYEGKVKLWQTSNRIEAAEVVIDRQKRRLEARGDVVSQLVDKKDARIQAAPVFTLMRAPEMVYTDSDRLAHYKGGVRLERPGLSVQSKELRAWLKNEPADKKRESGSSLDHALAEGSVVIVQTAKDRTRKGAGEHAEYEVAEEKVTLYGGAPMMEDSLRGTTRGGKLTWFAGNDRLLVDGAPSQPATSRLRKR